ncbi:MAG: cobalamin-dependent protein [Candidatus Aminicenantes bacterium]|nr:MAG: cobalamin-dependent protein [Candidatus Aminicenantes bacterium]
MKLKILLAAVFNEKPLKIEEIGIASIAAVLRENGYQIMITGGSENEIDYSKIIHLQPDIIGCPVYSISKSSFYKFCLRVKEYLPRVYICAGGNFPTFNAREMMNEAHFIDFIVRGEGEFTFLELAASIEGKKDFKNIKGLVYRAGDKIIVNDDRELIPDINRLPFPHRDFLIANKSKIAPISTSRGCMAHCTFCFAGPFWKKWRGRNVENILAEITYLYQLGIKHFMFVDSSFEDSYEGLNRLKGIAQGIIDMKLDISYRVNLRTDFYQKANSGITDLLKKSGLSLVLIGIESGNEEDLKLYGVTTSPGENSNCLEFFRNHQIPIEFGFINFNPYSTFERLKKNIDFLEKNRLSFSLYKIKSRYQNLKGNPLSEKVRRDKLIKKGKFDDYFNYDFVDRRVGLLWDYIASYYEKTRAIMEGIMSREFYLAKLNLLKEKIKDDNKAREIIRLHNLEIKEKLDEIGKNNAECFRELIFLAEHSWDEKKADMITDKFCSMDDLQETSINMKRKGIQFLQKMYSLGPRYSDILGMFFLDLGTN